MTVVGGLENIDPAELAAGVVAGFAGVYNAKVVLAATDQARTDRASRENFETWVKAALVFAATQDMRTVETAVGAVSILVRRARG